MDFWDREPSLPPPAPDRDGRPPEIACVELSCFEKTRFPRRNGWSHYPSGWMCPRCERDNRFRDPTGWSAP